jgi:hypothetical protein
MFIVILIKIQYINYNILSIKAIFTTNFIIQTQKQSVQFILNINSINSNGKFQLNNTRPVFIYGIETP